MIFPSSCKLVIILRLKAVVGGVLMQGEDRGPNGNNDGLEQETDNIVSLMISIKKEKKQT